MSVHVGVKSANMLSCGSQRAEAFPYKRAAVWCHTLVADSLALRLRRQALLNMPED